jgi:uncharacterized repeat protein (TIGR01451 family)
MRSLRALTAAIGCMLLLLAGSSALALGTPPSLPGASPSTARDSANSPRVSIDKVARPRHVSPGGAITYVLTLSNPMEVASPGLYVTDTIPLQTSFVKLISQGAYDELRRSVLWSGSLPPSTAVEISFSVRVEDTSITNTMIINRAWLSDGEQLSQAWDWSSVGAPKLYVPMALGYSLPLPATPLLNDIQPPAANPLYGVAWNAVEGATSYVLQQDSDPTFPAPAEVYVGAATSIEIRSQGIQTHYYRVRAVNLFGESGWSNTETVAVFWEREPNDPWSTNANGPLLSGQFHFGYQNDQKDFFWFDVSKYGTIHVKLANASADGVQLQLFYKPADQLSRVAYRVAPPYNIDYTGEAGRYYVYVYATGGYNESQPYTLWVDYSK